MLLVTLLVASSVLCGSNALGGGYLYPQPHPPIYQDVTEPLPPYLPPNLPPVVDDAPEISPTYLPSNPIYPPLDIPSLVIQPPVIGTPGITETDDSVIVEVPSFPEQLLPPAYPYLPPNRKKVPVQNHFVKISNLSCVDSTDENSRFYAQFSTIQSFKMSPTMEAKTPSDCLNVVADNLFRIQLEGPRVRECGVRRCITATSKQRRMCVNLRMATVKGIKLPEDFSISLQCIPQPMVLAHTKEIRFRPQTNRQRSIGRSIAVASGGRQRKLDMKLDLLRKSGTSGEFNEVVQAETPVFLGEELLLRTSVMDGSGWHNTKMDSVVMRSATTQQFVTLVDEVGCTNPSMRSVCPDQPKQISSLVVILPIRAFLFEDSGDAEEMVLSLRMIGCWSPRDCLQVSHCNDLGPIQTKKRSARSSNVNDEANDVEVRFKVLPFEKKKATPVLEQSIGDEGIFSSESFIYITSIIFIALASILFIIIFILLKRMRVL